MTSMLNFAAGAALVIHSAEQSTIRRREPPV
jgi:hypothetical protein